MSETCIVCLGDLGENASALPLSVVEDIVSDVDAKRAAEGAAETQTRSPLSSPTSIPKASDLDPELIAHLLPCGHHLHDECLRPWVERANSCPICRQTFNQVEIVKTVGGPVLSSYAVQDRIQVAEIDPSLLLEIEDEAEIDFGPCQVCLSEDDEDVLLICEGCDKAWHIYCIGLQHVPAGSWYCETCALSRAIEASYESIHSRRSASWRHSVRTRAQVRQNRNNVLTRSSDWARVWESIRDRTTIDLDFPYHNEGSAEAPRIRTNRQRELRAWERRLRIAEEHGTSRQLRGIAPGLEDELYDAPAPSRPRPEPEEPESMEEILAWNAMEKARDIDADPSGRSRKRRRTDSITESPASPHPPPDPVPRKRPRVRRPNEVQEVIPDVGESSTPRRIHAPNPSANPGTNGAPSFLQSLLREVESSAVEEESRGRPRLSLRATSDHASPQGSSPDASPTSSNAPSPRAGSASPVRTRPGSPLLTSRIEPIYPQLGPNGEPCVTQIINSPPERPKLRPKSRIEISHRTRDWVEANEASPQRAADSSPTRMNMSLSAKEKIQRLVKEALKEPYHQNQVDKDQYTDINRNVSRMLYDRIGEDGDVDGNESASWRQLANSAVAKAVAELQMKEGG